MNDVTDEMADNVTLRPAGASDGELIFSWRNDPSIVALGTLQREVSRAEHDTWFAATVLGLERTIFIIVCDEEPAGQIRLDWSGADSATVSIYLVRRFTGKGVGVVAIRLACERAWLSRKARRFAAWIRAENNRSISAFLKAGFYIDEAGPARPGHIVMKMELPQHIPHNRLVVGIEEEQAVARVVRSGHWAAGGELVKLESRIAERAGVDYAIGVGSGLGALRLALLSLGATSGDAIAVPAYSCVALANAVLACGARPVAVDVEAGTWNIRADALREARRTSPNLKAVVVVHTFGCATNIVELQSVGLPIVEDCSHAFGRLPFGNKGTLAVLSLYATKLLGAGEGGMIVTRDANLAAQLRAARDYADRAPGSTRLNDKMTDVEAALGGCQLDRLDQALARRADLAQRYLAKLREHAHIGKMILPLDQPGRIWYRFALQVERVDIVIERLRAAGVHAARPVENWIEGVERTAPVSAAAFGSLLSLPLYPALSDREHDVVCSALLRAVLNP